MRAGAAPLPLIPASDGEERPRGHRGTSIQVCISGHRVMLCITFTIID